MAPRAGVSTGGDAAPRPTNWSAKFGLAASGGVCRSVWPAAGGVGVSDSVDMVKIGGGGDSKSARASKASYSRSKEGFSSS